MFKFGDEIRVNENVADWMINGAGEPDPVDVDAMLRLDEELGGFEFVVDSWVEGLDGAPCELTGQGVGNVWGRIEPVTASRA